MKHKSISFKYYLFFSFLLVSWAPVIAFALWTYQGLVDRERAEVYDRHLLTSKNIALALTRYANDAESAFLMASSFLRSNGPDDELIAPIMEHLGALGFEHICIVDGELNIHSHCCGPADHLEEGLRTAKAEIDAGLAANPDGVVWTGVAPSASGQPRIYVAARVGDGLTAIGELTTDYFLNLQDSIRFGQLGHAAIFDRSGRVIAHPRREWVDSRRDLSEVKPVKAMMEGRTGVIEFFSPAIEANMIAGFAVVPETGWGIMVPQPVQELYEYADHIAWIALQLVVIAMGATAIISWLLARGLSGSLQPLLSVADRIAAGDLSARVGSTSSIGPREVTIVSSAIDQTMDQLTSANRKQLDAYAEVDRAKSQMLAHVSHELRTPLNAIIGFSDVIRREVFGPIGKRRYVDYADDIANSGTHLLHLVDQLLQVAQNDLSPGHPHVEDVDITQVVSGAMTIAASASIGPRSWTHTFAEDLPRVRGNRHQFSQMMINLLENAAKYSDDGDRITTEVAQTGDGDLMIRVEDTGIGMTAEEVESCMTPFGRGTSALVRGRKGVGLGLSVVASIVSAHDSTIRIDSTPGEGTRVSIVIPKSRLL